MESGTPTATRRRQRFLAHSLLLHLRPSWAPVRAIRFPHTFGLGGIALVLVLLLMASGRLMSFVYDAASERAQQSIAVMQQGLLAVAIEDRRVLVETTRRIRGTDFEPEQVARAGSSA